MKANPITSHLAARLPAVVLVGLLISPSWAFDDTGWCEAPEGSPVIACDDFDDYCPDPPCNDAIGDDTPDQAAFLALWPSDGCHTEPDEFGVSEPIYARVQADTTCGEWSGDPPAPPGSEPCADSLPFAIRQVKGLYYPDAKNNQYLFDGTSHKYDMRPRIAQLDPTKGSVNGTIANPLVLKFVLDLPGDSTHRFDAAQTNRYVELTDGSDRAAAEVQIIECDTGKLRPQVTTDDGMDHDSIAIGMFAVLDPDPCSPEDKPLTYRLSVYNGDRWYELKGNIFGYGNPSGDGLKVGGHLNYVTLTITDTLYVEINSTIDGLPWNETATVPREYTGGFSAMHVGNGACLPCNKRNYVDNLVLTGGELGAPISTGACCLDDGSCIPDISAAGCENLHGGTYKGDGVDCVTASCPIPNGACCLPTGTCLEIDEASCLSQDGEFTGAHSICGDILCCPKPFGDSDGDLDMDQTDFAAFQVCFTGAIGGVPAGCECYDRDDATGAQGGDGDIDGADFVWFENCITGPTVPLDFQNLPLGCVP